jgi:hypothetical protein
MITITTDNGINTATGTGYVLVYTSANVFITVQHKNNDGKIQSIHNMEGYDTKSEAYAPILNIPLNNNLFKGSSSQIKSTSDFTDGEIVINTDHNSFWELINGVWYDLAGNPV